MKFSKLKNGSIILSLNYGKLDIPGSEIRYIKSEGNYSKLFLSNSSSELLTSFTLKKFSKTLLQKPHYFLTSRGMLVNLHHSKRIEERNGAMVLIMDNGEAVEVSRRSRKKLIHHIVFHDFKIQAVM